MDGVDLEALYLETLWDGPTNVCALIQDIPDPASLSILAAVIPATIEAVGGITLLRFQETVRNQYVSFTQPGQPDGPSRWIL